MSANTTARSALAKSLQVQRAPMLPKPQREVSRVLQPGHAPAQLSLLLRPAGAR